MHRESTTHKGPVTVVPTLTGARQSALCAAPEQRGVDSRWMDNFDALAEYARRFGHCRPPYRGLVDGRNLYAWAARQRSRRSTLIEKERDLLESLPGWSWNFRVAHWNENFHALQAFAEREGHCRVPRGHIENGVSLGRLVGAQRQRLHTMDPEHRRLLESLPGWSPEVRGVRWWETRASLARFAVEHGHTRVPYDACFEGRRLGAWVARQRVSYRKDRLSPPRVRALESLPGWTWSPMAKPLDYLAAS